MRLLVCAALITLLATPAAAQRRPIGAETAPTEALPEGDAVDESAATKNEEAQNKRKADAAKKAEAERQAILDEEKKREEAEAAATKAAEAARLKKEEAATAKKAEAERKKQEDTDKRARADLNAARTERVLVRNFNNLRVRLTLKPGAPEIKAVQEVRLDVAEKLAVPDSRYGEYKPLRDAQLVATLRYVEAMGDAKPAPKKGRKPEAIPDPLQYRVHSLEDAGVYGFHLTMRTPGRYEVKIEGKDAAGQRIEAAFDLFPGQWPPPDWAEERARATESSSRRSPITF
ncbi:MAG: hypothetical protein ABIJ09_22355 [Pseudomonadota bacterium]